ncbi:hypothetical protein [Streptomyces sp. NPDC089919]|uniref:hypothetical protein n=1 Tax=Streptomyces sp. NPDC089919 TaxID=3155188 RepID=UPI00342CDB11
MAHAAPTAPGRQIGGMRSMGGGALALPLVLGLLYGVYAAFMKRDQSAVTVGNVFYGILCGAVFAVLLFGLRQMGRGIPQELRAAAWGAFAGIAIGYLYSMVGFSLWRTVVVALAVAVPTTVYFMYRYHTREP